jgi:hypothetical protein
MARVLVSYYKIQEASIDKMLCYWDGFVHELRDAGNDVFVINTGYFNAYDSNEVLNEELDALLLEKARAFDPELIITFNHRIPKSFLEEFEDVPLFLWDGDNLMYFCDLPYIEENRERYQVISIVQDWRQDYLDFGFRNDQVFYVPPATAVRTRDLEQTMNVSFLGIRLYHKSSYFNYAKSHSFAPAFGNIVEEFLNTGNYRYRELFEKQFAKEHPELVLSFEDLLPLFDYRWLILANMLDLGLTISGYKSRWEDTVEYMPQLVAAYDPRRIWTLDDNINFYNASKVSLCPMSPQAQGSGFSWRVFDIMASNACLLMTTSSDLAALTKGQVDIPMFDTPWEARDWAKRLLADDSLRRDIVACSQEYVDKNARWIHRFRYIQEVTGIKIATETLQNCNLYNVMIDDADVRELLEHYGDDGIRKAVSISTGASKDPNLSKNEELSRLLSIVKKRVRLSDIAGCLSTGVSFVLLGLLIDVFLAVGILAGALELVGACLVFVSVFLAAAKLYIWQRKLSAKAAAGRAHMDEMRR